MSKRLFSRYASLKILKISLILLPLLTLSSCLDKGKSKPGSVDGIGLKLNLPESLTGFRGGQASSLAAKGNIIVLDNDNDDFGTCAYQGPEDDEIFENGYNLTKFMTSAVASWTCIGDKLIGISSVLPADGKIRTTEHDADAPNYDPGEPSHYKVQKAKDGNTNIYLYYAYGHSQALPDTATPGFFISWQKNGSTITGKMIIDAYAINNPARDDDDPSQVRMDFTYTATQKLADMYMTFDSGNEWANGFRIQVIENLTVAATGQVFTARGKIDMTKQFVAASGIDEIPTFNVYTVSDQAGKGAAYANFDDLALSVPIDESKHLGNYIADKLDIYFFDENSDWDWIDKSFSNTELRGNARNLDSEDIDYIEGLLGIPDYFNNSCNIELAECDDLINFIFEDGLYAQEENQGEDPADWRSNALLNVNYLDSVYPAGSVSWDGVFVTE